MTFTKLPADKPQKVSESATLVSLRLFLLFFGGDFWAHHAACGMLVPQPGIKPGPSVLTHGVLTTLYHQGILMELVFLIFSFSRSIWLIYNVLLQVCSKEIQLYIYTWPLFQPLFPYKLLKPVEYNFLWYRVGLCWWSNYYKIYIYILVCIGFFHLIYPFHSPFPFGKHVACPSLWIYFFAN